MIIDIDEKNLLERERERVYREFFGVNFLDNVIWFFIFGKFIV